ncbi:unnamed protein product [Cylindrotheca closterium]|uniref:K Homology domain-containing protein n=1 Tax=Cylindrotheca closterium TaxID=2856 RepID=A0AAD2CIS0_9STRA|nr:unnamed protein product [Cylindrotheca closterium]
MTTTAEEALARAKAIASRLSGSIEANGQPPISASSARPKRNRWGVAPSTVAATPSLPGLAAIQEQAKKKQKTAADESSKRVWVKTTAERPESHFYSYFSTRLGNIAEDTNKEEGIKDDASTDALKILLKGRGSTNKPAPPGFPEEPMHILISGPDALVSKADIQVDNLLIEAERAPPENIPPETEGEEGTHDNNLALTTTGYHSSGYRPATVAQMISNNPVINNMGGNLIEEEIKVPNGIVGFLIGRGGETISSMQARSGCKVQIQKEHELQPGQTHRVITLQATAQDSVDQCRELIESMVQDRIRAAGGGMGGGKDMKVNEAVSMGHALVKVEVPDADVGLIIGKGGSTIKSIQESTGASIQIPPSGNDDNPTVRTISITHPNEHGANAAKQQVEHVLSSKPSYAQASGPQITIEIMIPDKDVGLCIGRGGCVIKEMQNKSGTRIQVPSYPTPGQPHRVATVSGTKEGCAKVQGMIDTIINQQSSTGIMGNGNQYLGQQFYGQSVVDQGGQHSAEWQAYYAAQAVAKQQEAPAPAVAAAPAPASDAYYEQFFRYSYYYGEDAARKHYGAWSPPVGTPNPYGVNPNGITAAPGAAPAPAPTPAPAAAPPPQQQDVRDTGRRGVSNLPAWMTRGN